MSVWAIVVAGGSGRRFGAPKQFEPLLGQRRVIDVATATAKHCCDGVVVVLPPTMINQPVEGATAVVAGGETRSDSVRSGLAAVPADAEIILVHDAARPGASVELFASVIESIKHGADGAVPVVAVVDTLRTRGGTAADRDQLVAVQTPQAFAAQILRAAHSSGESATDDASLVDAFGGRVDHVEGETSNFKITEVGDLQRMREELQPSTSSSSRDLLAVLGTLRVGNGFDVHRFSTDTDRQLVLGGVHFPGEPGLVGQSDADVVAHACAEALLGAVGLGDLGSHFPDTDEQYRGADSMKLLAEVVDLVAREGYRVLNIDCSVIAERPKLAPVRQTMQERLAHVVGAPVSVKGRRAEKLGSLGRKEGIACLASALVVGEGDTLGTAFEQ